MAYHPDDPRSIFDAFNAMCDAIHKADAERERVNKIVERAKRRCGHCVKWMCRPECPRELGVMKGGPSCNGFPCDQFVGKKDQQEAVAELAALRSQ